MKLKLCLILLFTFITVSPVFGIDQPDKKISVVVSIAPQAFFAKQIAGDHVNISTMVQSGDNPATYEPKPKQMMTISKASIYFAIGVPFEKSWLKKFADINQKMTIVNTDDGIKKLIMKSHIDCEHIKTEPQNCKNYRQKVEDPHIWTSPPIVKIIAQNMAKALIKLDPNNKNIYLNNLEKFEIKLDCLHNEIILLFKEKECTEFMVFHPSWGYFANTYGLTQIVAEVEGKAPKSAQLAELIKNALEKNLKVIFAQPQFSITSAKIIANAINGKVVFADPLAYDWMNNIKNQALKFSLTIE